MLDNLLIYVASAYASFLFRLPKLHDGAILDVAIRLGEAPGNRSLRFLFYRLLDGFEHPIGDASFFFFAKAVPSEIAQAPAEERQARPVGQESQEAWEAVCWRSGCRPGLAGH